jgi:nucleotide-binding universal stress UspA family protein
MRIKRILAATDGSTQGEHGVALAQALSREAGQKVEVLAVETGGLPLPGVEIVHRAEAWGADLVVLGRAEPPASPAVSRGSTADAVVRRSKGPSLLVPRSAKKKILRVMLALDGTQRGMGVLGGAMPLVALTGAQVKAILVLPDLSVCFPDSDGRKHPARSLVEEALERVPDLGGRRILEVRHGDPVREIVDAMRSCGADLLVIGVRRGGPTGEMGSGHVGQDLLQTVPGAILTVPI